MRNSERYLLGIDIGGTGCKAGVYLHGETVGQGYHEHRMISTIPGQAEQDANAWWEGAVFSIRQAIKDVPAEKISAIGIGCTNGLVAVDETCKPLRPAIMLWDQRAFPQVEYLKSIINPEEIFSICGNPVAPGTYSLPTILWLKQDEPEIFAKAYKFLVPGGYLIAKMTGNFTIDHSRACTTLLFDIRQKQWHQPFLDELGIPNEKLPEPVKPEKVVGWVTKEVSKITGLKEGTPVIGGCMDTLGAAIGADCVMPGDYFIIMGTAARVVVSLDKPIFDPSFMNCTSVFPDRWLEFGAINGVGSALRWTRNELAIPEQEIANSTGRNVYELITEQAQTSPPGGKGLLFLPYMSGERTPVWDPNARGVFLGMTLGHTRADIFRTILEGPALPGVVPTV